MPKPLAAIVLIACAAALVFSHSQSIWLMFFSITILLISLASLFGLMPTPRKSMTLREMSAGEYRLTPRLTPAEQIRRFAVPIAIAVLTGFGLLASRLALHPSPRTNVWVAPLLGILIANFVATISGLVWRKRAFVAAEIALDTDHPRIDRPLHLNVQLAAREPVASITCQAHFHCFENLVMHSGRYTQLVSRGHSEKTIDICTAVPISPDEPMEKKVEVTLGSAAHFPTGKPRVSSYPNYHWELHLEITGPRKMVLVYPLTVEGEFAREVKPIHF
jgi:hypothetical protein